MKTKIIAKDRGHLIKLIQNEIKINGFQCDLNHIDVSLVANMESLFSNSKFNGDISKWDVSNVEDMFEMFWHAKFNGDISQWNVSKVENMHYIFYHAEFNGDISNWKPYNLEKTLNMFGKFNSAFPYWAEYKDKESRKTAIDAYHLNKELEQKLNNGGNSAQRIKI